jgi:hypothetical protein
LTQCPQHAVGQSLPVNLVERVVKREPDAMNSELSTTIVCRL